jgi:exonuclease VII large subunit
MASLAYDAISIVLREHAGLLKSFKEDKRKILNRTNDILHECETKAEEFMNVGRWEDVSKIRAETLDRLRKFAPTEETYVKTYFENQRTYKKRLSDDRRNETRRMKRRTTKTQHDRIHQVITLFDKFYATRTRPTDMAMTRIQTRIREILPEIEWVCAEIDGTILEWLGITFKRLLPMVCNV